MEKFHFLDLPYTCGFFFLLAESQPLAERYGAADGRSDGWGRSPRPRLPGTSRRELSKWRARQLEVSKHGNKQLERVAKGNGENESVYRRIGL